MSSHKYIDRICLASILAALILCAVFMNAAKFGVLAAPKMKEYESRLFDAGSVHTVDIIMDDWDGFLETCTDEEYALCSLVIDNETWQNVAIRAKGNTSLTQVAQYGNNRYSFKIEFDHYDNAKNYYGLDKLCFNNLIQDNTCMKDFFSYQMMGYFGADAPLCSYTYITVNGEDWGLYLAVEGIEEAFLERNYGRDYGHAYKPDSMDMGGGRGNGKKFQMDGWNPDGENMPDFDSFEPDMDSRGINPKTGQDKSGNTTDASGADNPATPENGIPDMPDGQTPSQNGIPRTPPDQAATKNAIPDIPAGQMPAQNDIPDMPDGQTPPQMPGKFGGASDVSLIYTDDSHESYRNIFDNAVTESSDSDKDRLIASLKQLNAQEQLEAIVDIDEVIRYFVVHNFVCNFDSYTGSMIHNYYLYEKDGQLSMIPWDYNLAFGGFGDMQDSDALVNYPIDTPVSGGTTESRPMLSWIFSDETYKDLYHQYFAEFIRTFFDSGYFSELIGKTRELISPYIQKDPTKFCTFEEFETGADALEEFCLLRAESITGQLGGAIPSTEEGQSQNPDALIDASGLNLSDMGNMGGMEGFGRTKGKMPDKNAPDFPRSFQSQTPDKSTLLFAGATAAVLLAGILIAAFYRKRV